MEEIYLSILETCDRMIKTANEDNDYDSEEELSRTIETLRYIQSTSTASLGKGITVPLRFSMGCCIVENEYDIQKLFKIADKRMYEDKVERKKQFAEAETE